MEKVRKHDNAQLVFHVVNHQDRCSRVGHFMENTVMNSVWLTNHTLEKMAAMLAEDNFRRIFMNGNVEILIQSSLKFVPQGSIDNKLALVQVMAYRWKGDKPLPETMLTQFTGVS